MTGTPSGGEIRADSLPVAGPSDAYVEGLDFALFAETQVRSPGAAGFSSGDIIETGEATGLAKSVSPVFFWTGSPCRGSLVPDTTGSVR